MRAYGCMTVFAVLLVGFTVLLSGCGRCAMCSQKTVLSADGFDAWKSHQGWQVAGGVMLDKDNPKLLATKPGKGILINGPVGKAEDLISRQQFGDAVIHVEFMISEGSNSGVYVQGQYEIQVFDSLRMKKPPYPGIECGGIYERWDENREPKGYEGYSPMVNAAKKPGEWQTFDIYFHAPEFDGEGNKIANARFDKVIHNGVVIHENVELSGPTRGPLVPNEVATGPLRLQGDHGPVAYRNIWICPLSCPK
jgi:hypothetical protein